MTTLTYWGQVWRRLVRNRLGLCGLIGIEIFAGFAIAAPLIASDKPLLRQDGAALWSPWALSLLDFGCYPSIMDRLLNCFLIIGLAFLALLPLAIFARVLFLPAVRSFWPSVGLTYVTCAVALFVTVSFTAFHYERPTAFYAPVTVNAAGESIPAKSAVEMRAPIPFSPDVKNPADTNLRPFGHDMAGRVHPLGTTLDGADVAAVLVHGSRTALIVAVAAIGLAALFGYFIGTLAALAGGVLDAVLGWVADSIAAMPALLLGIAALAMIPAKAPSIMWAVVAIAAVGWVPIARLVRREVRREHGQSHIDAARALGGNYRHLLVHHLMPAGVGPMLVASCFGMALAVGLETALAFFGLAPSPHSWGELLRQGHDLPGRPLLIVLPALAVFVPILFFNMVGEALHVAYRDVQSKSADPRT